MNKSVKLYSLIAAVLLVSRVAAQEAASGVELFNNNCSNCHGANGQGGQLAPSLLKKVADSDDAALTAFLRTGNPVKGMPPAPVPLAEFPALMSYLRFLASTVSDATYSTDDTRNQYASMPIIKNFVPVTDQILNHPSANDWLWFSRTPDAQRFSPLDQINRENVKQLSLAWSRGLPAGNTETIPTVYNGVMYLTLPGGNVAAFDATTGDQIWQYRREYKSAGAGGSGRSKTMAIYDDMIYFTAPDEAIVALDARTGAVRWEASTPGRGNTSGAIVVKGKVLSGGTCMRSRESCYISAHDAHTGKLVWKFMTTQAPTDPPGFDTWGGKPLDERRASTWGLPGSYDEQTNILYWSVANPSPYTRLERHGSPDAVSDTAPADLYSNSTLALDPDTGKLLWYYQQLPADDWDADMNEERIILRTPFNPDPRHVKWINPDVPKGQPRDIVVSIGEVGGIFALDKKTGQFLWANPFPSVVPNFAVKDIDVHTGATRINRDVVAKRPGDHNLLCFFNTRSYWPTAYNPQSNYLYVPYINNCLNMTAAMPATEKMPAMPESRIGSPLPGLDLDELNGLARINMETGEITHWPTGRIPTNSAMLVTAGNVVFWGDINRRYRAVDADNGQVLWETILGAPISNSNITYSVNGKQYVAVITGDNMSHPGLNTGTMGPIRLNLSSSYNSNTLYVFALPDHK